jgi:hypothetical protein
MATSEWDSRQHVRLRVISIVRPFAESQSPSPGRADVSEEGFVEDRESSHRTFDALRMGPGGDETPWLGLSDDRRCGHTSPAEA